MSYPSICKHKFFKKDILVMYVVYDKLPKDANVMYVVYDKIPKDENKYGIPDVNHPSFE